MHNLMYTYETGQRNDRGQVICGSKTRKEGNPPCGNTAIMPNGRCRMHRGKAASGVNNGNFKHGRYSKDIPTRMRARFEAGLNDAQLLRLVSEISLTDARIEDLLSRVDSGESGQAWHRLGRLWTAHKVAAGKGDKAALNQILVDIDAVIDQGVGDWAIWQEIGQTIQQRERLTASERKGQLEAQQYVKVEQVMVMVSRIESLILENVQERGARIAISNGLRQLLEAEG